MEVGNLQTTIEDIRSLTSFTNNPFTGAGLRAQWLVRPSPVTPRRRVCDLLCGLTEVASRVGCAAHGYWDRDVAETRKEVLAKLDTIRDMLTSVRGVSRCPWTPVRRGIVVKLRCVSWRRQFSAASAGSSSESISRFLTFSRDAFQMQSQLKAVQAR